MALDRMGVDLTDVPSSAFGHVFRLARQTDGGRRALPDRAGDASLATRFPNVARIRQG
jgi:hypothetical protein